jgi:hypothetical protein
MVKTIFLFWGGAVAVFDEHGEQMPELQGNYFDVVERLRREDLSHAEIHAHEVIGIGERPTPEQFLSLSQADFEAAAESFSQRNKEGVR